MMLDFEAIASRKKSISPIYVGQVSLVERQDTQAYEDTTWL